MNYSAHYDRLIARAREHTLVGYKERHHVLPRCMGGGNEHENLVYLTAEEHYVAHQLLVKMYPGIPGLVWGALRLARKCFNNKAYGWLRRKHAIAASEAMRGRRHSPESRAKMSAIQLALKTRLGKKHSSETRAKISASQLGKKHSPEHIEKMAAALRGKKHSPEAKARMSVAQRGNKNNLGKTLSPETREKIAAAHRGMKASLDARSNMAAAHLGKNGRPHSLESRAKMSIAALGNQRCLGKICLPETRAKIGAANRGKYRTTELRARISAALTGKHWSDARRAAYLVAQAVRM